MPGTILLVDDEEMILDSLSAILSKEGYKVDCAQSGDEALTILKEKNYDLVITDIRMPGISGIEMVERVRGFTPQPKIMVMTGYGSLETAVKAQHRGVCDYLIKPIDIKGLKKSIRRALSSGSETQELEPKHLDRKLKDWMEYFSLVSDFTASLNASLDLREVVDITVDRLKKIAETDRSSLVLFPKTVSELYYLKNREEMPALSQGNGISISLAGAAEWITEPLRVTAGSESESGQPDPRRIHVEQAMAREEVRQAVLMPLIVKGRTIGIVDVCSTRENPFTDIDIMLFTALVNQASLALAKALSYLEKEERSMEIELLYNLSLKLNQSLKISDSIKAICEGAVDITGAVGSLLQTSLEPASIKNFIFHRDPGFHKEMKRGSQDWLIPKTARKEAFFSNDPVMDPRVNSLALYSLGIRSLAYVPLIYEWEDLGGLTVFHKTEGKTFDQRDLHLLHLFARHASEVLLNSQLFEAIKKSREKIITEKSKMDIVLSNMADGVVNIVPSGRISYVNEVMLKMLGVREDEVVGRPCHEVFAMVQCAAGCPVRGAGGSTDAQEFFETTIESKSEGSIPVYVSLASVHDGEGKVSGWVKVVRNMYKIKEVENLKDSFIHALAHDLRAPLTSIMGFIEVLDEKGSLPDEQKRYLTLMHDSASSMNAIINNLLDAYRSKNVKLTVREEEIDIKDAVLSALQEMEGMARVKGVSLLGAGTGGALKVHADSSLIKRVLNNLLSNAIKFTPDGGSVKINARMVSMGDGRVTKEEGRERSDEIVPRPREQQEPSSVIPRVMSDRPPSIEISVEDTGTGIPAGELENIFNKFYQAANAMDSVAAAGTGLGLAITKEIVEAHGGKIWVERAESGGTKFKFTIPLRDA